MSKADQGRTLLINSPLSGGYIDSPDVIIADMHYFGLVNDLIRKYKELLLVLNKWLYTLALQGTVDDISSFIPQKIITVNKGLLYLHGTNTH